MGPTGGAPEAGARVAHAAAANHKSFRRQVRAGALALLVLNVAIALLARQQQHAIIDHALDIYDTAFISTNYIHLAQVGFQHYRDDRSSPAVPEDGAKAGADLEN